MFDQTQDQQQAANDQDSYSKLFDAAAPNIPAPGAPAGPIDDGGAVPSHDEPAEEKPAEDTAVEDKATEVVAPTTSSNASDDLLDIKQDALHELAPLVGQLNQSPEEKFKTTMMMIQASDDQSLVKTAYEAAKQIEDEKTRAQALLDVVNEINYFTQSHNNS